MYNFTLITCFREAEHFPKFIVYLETLFHPRNNRFVSNNCGTLSYLLDWLYFGGSQTIKEVSYKFHYSRDQGV